MTPVDPGGRAPDRRSLGFLLVYALATTGGVIGYLPLLTLLLPIRVEALAGSARVGTLALATIAGAIAASLANILFGWLSDRPAVHGRPLQRRRWVVGGLIATALAYAVIAVAPSPGMIVAAIVLFQIALNMALAPLLAIMADEVPDTQKGLAGGLLAFAQPVAALVSVALMRGPVEPEGWRFAALPLLAALFMLPFLTTRSRPTAAGTATATPTTRPDLAWAWCARLLIQIAGNVLFLYLLYYLESVAAETAPETQAHRASEVQFAAYLLALPVAIGIGRLSDRVQRRKPFLLAAAALAAGGLAAMAVAPGWQVAATGFVAYAVGSAAFLSLHAAYAMQLLPHPRHRGRDLGLFNLTNTMPSLIGPALAWWLATPQHFGHLLLVLAALTLVGGLAILPVRSRR